MKYLFFAFALLSASVSFANDSFKEGEHYQTLNTPQSKAAKVVEYFSYYCPFCYNFEPIVAELKQALPGTVPLYKVPVSFLGGNMAATVQRGHAMAGTLAVEDAFSAALFNQIHQLRKAPENRAAIKNLFADIGVTDEQFEANFDSMPINSIVAEFDAATERANIRSVPSFVINDKYLVNISAVSSQEQFNALINYLLTLTNETSAP